jgi:hypothetical protein
MNFPTQLRGSLLVLTALGLCACSGSEPGGEKVAALASELSVLDPLASCADLEGAIRQMALKDMNEAIDAQERAVLAIAYADCNSWGVDASYANAPSAAAGASAEDSAGGAGSGPKSTTGTNNQVDGVDEADFVKNDGKFIYVANNGALRILRSWPAASTAAIAEVPLDGTPKKLFLDGDRVLVYESIGGAQGGSGEGYYGPGYGGGECTYGYECELRGDGTKTRLEVFDVTDRAAPQKLRTVELSGSLIAARKIGHAVHTVVSQAMAPFVGLQTYPSGIGYVTCNMDSDQVLAAFRSFEQLRAQNAKIILEQPLTGVLPTITDTAGPSPVADCRNYYKAALGDGSDILSIVSLDMSKEEPANAASVLSRPGAVYASGQSLYIAVPHDFGGAGDYYAAYGQSQVSTVHRFRISADPSATAYAASGAVGGRVLNQFAMDELDGRLRIATSTGYVPDPNVSNSLAVLRQEGSSLLLQGLVAGFAPGEDIRSVRFQGEAAYVVTFKKTDPLWAFDLSDPTNPRITGELQIPGFSTYMHRMDAGHLLTIGYDANDHGNFAFFDGVLLQIFDVSNPAAPTLVHKHKIGTRGSSSEALTNHLAFTYAADRGLLGIPMTICEGGGDGSYGTDMTFSGLMVFGVDAAKGFTELGRVAHPNTPDQNGYDSGACSNWWTNASSEVKRSIFMDDFVYSVSESVVKVQALSKLGEDLASVPLD